MKNYKKKKMITALFFVFMAALIAFPSVSDAAIVGERLAAPEDGWNRFDDTDKRIEYRGTVTWLRAQNSQRWNQTLVFIPGMQLDESKASIHFTFKGSKLRILDEMSNERAKNIVLNIDGKDYIYSSYHPNYTNPSPLFTGLSYETPELENKIHTVKIYSNDYGNITLDAIDIYDGTLIDLNTPLNLIAEGNDEKVSLSWNKINNATNYIVRYGTESGNYTKIINATKDDHGNLIISGLQNGTKYYFVVSSLINGVESDYSNEATATPKGTSVDPEQPSGDRAILIVTMTTGLEKEYDLGMQEVNDFINWYEAKQEGTGKASYAINKHDSNKGPFKSRKDYILFDRILTFEVSEY